MNGQEWDVRSSARECETCRRAFADGETVVSRLCHDESAGYRRCDTCAACEAPPLAGAVSVWRTVFHPPAPPPEEPVRKETAESLLRKYMETSEAAHAPVIFVLAVMLERKRLLIERDVQLMEDGSRRRIYEHRATGETFVVPDPGLRLDRLEQVQQEVVVLLGGRPRGAPSAPAAPPAATGGEAAAPTDA